MSDECGHCGESVSVKRQGIRGRPPKFCSVECKDAACNAARRQASLDQRRGRSCQQCDIELPAAMSGKAKFCSDVCSYTWHNWKRVAAKKEANLARRLPCHGCGAEIPKARKSHAMYCSRECMARHVRARNYDTERARDYNRKYHYGLSSEEFTEILTAQDGKCAICGTTDWPGRHNKPHVDHCHETGLVRGVLCTNCNSGLGQFRDRTDLLEAAIAYLRR